MSCLFEFHIWYVMQMPNHHTNTEAYHTLTPGMAFSTYFVTQIFSFNRSRAVGLQVAHGKLHLHVFHLHPHIHTTAFKATCECLTLRSFTPLHKRSRFTIRKCHAALPNPIPTNCRGCYSKELFGKLVTMMASVHSRPMVGLISSLLVT